MKLTNTGTSNTQYDRQEKLNHLKQMAMADGVLTENEKKLFRQIIPMTDEEADELFRTIESELEAVQSETEVIDWKRKNGYDFEKFIVSRCPAKFEIKQWTSDKFVEGKYDAHNLDPDLLLEVVTSAHKYPIAIECKFHMGFVDDWVFVAREEQLERYRQFQEEHQYPVFIAIGMGGSGANPEELFIVPISALKYPHARRDYLRQFAVDPRYKLFYDTKSNRFRGRNGKQSPRIGK